MKHFDIIIFIALLSSLRSCFATVLSKIRMQNKLTLRCYTTDQDYNTLPMKSLEEKDCDAKCFSETLKNFASKQLTLRHQDHIQLVSLILKHINSMDSISLGDMVWSLGKMSPKDNFLDKMTLDAVYNRIISLSELSSNIDYLKILSGFISLGMRWESIPGPVQHRFLDAFLLLELPNEKVDGRQISAFVYSLGLLGATENSLSMEHLSLLQSTLSAGMTYSSFNPQSLANSALGLSRIGFRWNVDLSENLKAALVDSTSRLADSLQTIELCSLLQSYANLQLPWRDLPSSTREGVTAAVVRVLPSTGRREFVNLIWSLGKVGLSWKSASAEETKMLETLLERLDATVIRSLTPFDLESLFVGLGLMEAPHRSIGHVEPALYAQISKLLPNMNIFCLHNTLWGLARMKMPIVETDIDLARRLLARAVTVLHTFLPEQIGDVIWALGSLGYKIGRDLTGADSERLQAVLSRVLGRLQPRAAAYIFWGLGKLGYRWKQFLVAAQSLPNGRPAEPLAEAAARYFNSRVGGMREQEFAVFLFSLGLLDASWKSLPVTLRDKVHGRVIKVAPFMSAWSLSNALWGLGKADTEWSTLPSPTRECLLALLTGARGLADMNTQEVVQSVHGLALMSATWQDVGPAVQTSILSVSKRAIDRVSCRALSTMLGSLHRMGCPPVLDLQGARAAVSNGLPGAYETYDSEKAFEPNVECFLYWLRHQRSEWWATETDRLLLVLESARQKTEYRHDQEIEADIGTCKAILQSWISASE